MKTNLKVPSPFGVFVLLNARTEGAAHDFLTVPSPFGVFVLLNSKSNVITNSLLKFRPLSGFLFS